MARPERPLPQGLQEGTVQGYSLEDALSDRVLGSLGKLTRSLTAARAVALPIGRPALPSGPYLGSPVFHQ